jgi:lipoate-protein ligase A
VQTLDFILQPGITPEVSLAADAHFLHVVGRPSRTRPGVLRVYEFAGDVLSLGRYHLSPPGPSVIGAVRVHRRQSGGRAIPFGDGFVGMALVLPHRSALLSGEQFALAPYQIMNRYARGILEGCKLVGVPAFYPGRDFITVNRRVLGLVSFEVDPTGALLFEAIIANRRDFSLLPHLLDAVDAGGVVKAEMLAPHDTTCLAQELGVQLTTVEVADLLRRGYEKQFAVAFADHALTPLEERAIEATVTHEFHDERWLRQRAPRADLDQHCCEPVQLGMFEAHFSLEQKRFIKEIMFAGDFIANSSAITRLEHELRLCPAEWRAIDAVASQTFAQPEDFILGIGRTRVIADTVCKGIGQ